MSPSYVKSEWCKTEIDSFCRAAAEHIGLKVGSKGRIFKVLKDPVPREEHPPVLQGQTGYEFFSFDKERQRSVQFTLTKGDETIARAKQVIDDLAYSIVETLKAVNQVAGDAPAIASEATSPIATTAASVPGAVYVAETHYELDDQRQQIRRELEARGLTVLPSGDLPLRNPEEFKQVVHEALAQCDVSVHMIAAKRSLVLPNEVEDTVYLQNQMAAERSAGGGLLRLIWMPSDLAVAAEDERQRNFVDMVGRDPEAQKGAEVLRVPLQGLIARIHDTLKKKRDASARKQEPASAGEEAASIYLISHPDDNEAVEPLRQHLNGQGFDVLEGLSDPEATEEDIAALHKMNLVDCSAAIVCVGNVRELWVRSMLSELQKAVGWREGEPFQARAIYFAPPANPFKQNLRKPGYLLLDGHAGFSAAAVQPFVDLLAQSAAGDR
jgi:hypothetical protein